MSADSSAAGEKFQQLVEIMARLRSPGGCPWDRAQNFDTIKPFLLEETYEVMDAIDARDWKAFAEELGDLLLQPVFFARMAAEAGLFRIEDALDSINSKLVRRHPHVFGGASAETPAEVVRNWDVIKNEEKKSAGQANPSLLGSVSRTAPALVEAQALTGKAARVGFDWENPEQVLEKVEEEMREVAEARRSGGHGALEGELGDLLFVLVNLARHLGIDAEQALRLTNAKFRTRFGYIERALAAQGKTAQEATLDEMEALWRQAKESEPAR